MLLLNILTNIELLLHWGEEKLHKELVPRGKRMIIKSVQVLEYEYTSHLCLMAGSSTCCQLLLFPSPLFQTLVLKFHWIV